MNLAMKSKLVKLLGKLMVLCGLNKVALLLWLQRRLAPSKDFPGFFPLSIDYREQFSAAGKIPGGYYKREGKLS